MRDNNNIEIARIRSKNDPRRGQDDAFPLLEELYSRARRVALQVEQKLNDVARILDKI